MNTDDFERLKWIRANLLGKALEDFNKTQGVKLDAEARERAERAAHNERLRQDWQASIQAEADARIRDAEAKEASRVESVLADDLKKAFHSWKAANPERSEDYYYQKVRPHILESLKLELYQKEADQRFEDFKRKSGNASIY